MLKRSRIAATAVLVVASTDAFAVDVKFGGRVNTELEMEGFRNGSSRVEAQIEMESERKDGTKAVIELRGRSDEDDAVLREALLDHKLSNDDRIYVGLMKKRFGLEYDRGHAKRHVSKRSPIYQKMQEFTYVGYETMAKYEQDAEDDPDGFGYSMSFGYNDSIDADLNFSLRKERSQDLLNYGLWLQVVADHVDDRRQIVWASAISVWADQQAFTYQLEMIGGQDPIETVFEQDFGDGAPVYFYGLKGELTLPFQLEGGTVVRPVLQSSRLTHDHREPHYRTDQVLVGLNYYPVKKLRIGLYGEYLATNSKLDLDDWNLDESNARLEVAYFF